MAGDSTLCPKDLEKPDKFPNLALALDNRGHKPGDVVKVFGGNWLRLFGQVWPGGLSNRNLSGTEETKSSRHCVS